MIWIALAMLASEPAAVAPLGVEPPVYEAEFAPLRRSERQYAGLGPAGPFYPEAAARARKNGEAVLQCVAIDGGALKQCRVMSDTPRDLNFGVAARVMSERKRISVS